MMMKAVVHHRFAKVAETVGEPSSCCDLDAMPSYRILLVTTASLAATSPVDSHDIDWRLHGQPLHSFYDSLVAAFD